MNLTTIHRTLAGEKKDSDKKPTLPLSYSKGLLADWEKAKAMPPGPEKDKAMREVRDTHKDLMEVYDPPGDMTGPLDKMVDYGLRVADYPSGIERLLLGSLAGQYKEGDVMRALKGQAPTGGEYLERAGVPAGPEMSLGKFKPSLRDIGGAVLDLAASPGFLGAGRALGKAFRTVVPAPIKMANRTAREARYAKALGEVKPSLPPAQQAVELLTNPWGAKAMDVVGEHAYQSAFRPENLAAAESFVMPLGQQAAERGYPILTAKGKAALAEDILKENVQRRNFLRSELASKAPDVVIPGEEVLKPTGAGLGMTPSEMTSPVLGGGLGMRKIKVGLKSERAIPIAGGAAENSLEWLQGEFDRIAKRPKTGLEGSGGPWAAVLVNKKPWAVPAKSKESFKAWVKEGNKPKKFPGAMKYEDYATARMTGYDVKEMSQIADAGQDVAAAKNLYKSFGAAPPRGSATKNVKNQIAGERLGQVGKDIGYNARRLEEEMADKISREANAASPDVAPKYFGGEIFERNQRIGGAADAAPIIKEQMDKSLMRLMREELPSLGAGTLAYWATKNPWAAVLFTSGGLTLSTPAGRMLVGKGLKTAAPASMLVRPTLLEIQRDKRGKPSPWSLMESDLNGRKE